MLFIRRLATRRSLIKLLSVGVCASLIYKYREPLLDSCLDRLAKITYERRTTHLPKRIIMIRHGESEGNVNHNIYKTVPDNCIELTEKGFEQAKEAGESLKKLWEMKKLKYTFLHTKGHFKLQG